jgi:carbohydrate diacid regulator
MKFLDQSLAQEIVDRTMKIIKRNINVMNDKGVIIGSGDPTRIDTIHEGALRVIENQKEFEIEEHDAKGLQGVKAGINLPINFNNQVVGVIGITGAPEEIRNYGELVKMAAEMILQQAVLIDQMQWDERLKEELISQLLHGTENLNSLYFERVRRLGINLDIPRLAVIVTAKDRAKVFKTLRDRLDKEDLLVMHPDYLILLKKVTSQNVVRIRSELEKWAEAAVKYLGLHSKLSIGNYHPELKGIADSYREAVETSFVGERIDPVKTIYFYDDYKIPVLLTRAKNLGSGEELQNYYQYLKENDKKGELVETLLVFIEENGDIHTITGKLFIHRNTLRYRLDKITEITGKDPRKIKDLLELYLSVIQELIK